MRGSCRDKCSSEFSRRVLSRLSLIYIPKRSCKNGDKSKTHLRVTQICTRTEQSAEGEYIFFFFSFPEETFETNNSLADIPSSWVYVHSLSCSLCYLSSLCSSFFFLFSFACNLLSDVFWFSIRFVVAKIGPGPSTVNCNNGGPPSSQRHSHKYLFTKIYTWATCFIR